MTWPSIKVILPRRLLRCMGVRNGRMVMDSTSTVFLDPIALLLQRLVPPPLLRPQGRALARYVFDNFGVYFQRLRVRVFCCLGRL